MFSFKSLRRWVYRRAVRFEGSPRRIAFGIGFGAFWGFLIPPGGQLISGIPLSILFGLNPIVFTLGTMVTNPITYPAAYLFSCKVGEMFLRHVCQIDLATVIAPKLIQQFIQALGNLELSQIANSMRELALCWIAGGVIVGLATAVPGYYLTYLIVIEARKVRELRRAKKLSIQRLLFKKEDLPELPPKKSDEVPSDARN